MYSPVADTCLVRAQLLLHDAEQPDAHFNLALLAERRGDFLNAVRHWKSYLKLDNSGTWANIARRQLEKLREATVIRPRPSA